MRERTAVAEAEGRSGPWVSSMSGFRGLVVWLIVADHMWNAGKEPVSIGLLDTIFASGTFFKLFFVISGFVLFLPIAARGGGLGTGAGSWIARRFVRIAPAYYLVLAVVLVAYPLLVGPAQPEGRSVGSVVAHLGFLQQELYPSSAGFGVDGPVWALSIFALFYLTLPLVASSFQRRPLLLLVAAIAISAAWPNLVGELGGGNAEVKQYPLFLQDFAFGMAAAWALITLQRQGPWLRSANGTVLAAWGVSLASLAVLVYLAGEAGGEGTPLLRHSELISAGVPAAFAALILTTAIAPAAIQRPLSGRTAAYLADTSYGVFLFHMIAIKFMLATWDLPGTAGTVASAAIVVGASLAVGHLSFRYLERPLRDRVRARLASPAPRGSAA